MKVIEKFATSKEVALLLDKCRQVKWGEFNPESIWEGRTYNNLSDPDVKNLTIDLLYRMKRAILENTDYDEIYLDCTNLVRWSQGYEMPPHADAENEDGSPHPFWYRKFGCILYLNTDFDGGEIYFPKKDITLKPEAGTLVFFPSTVEWLHGVKETKNGERYNMATFWTEDKSKNIL